VVLAAADCLDGTGRPLNLNMTLNLKSAFVRWQRTVAGHVLACVQQATNLAVVVAS
jgi:hypothetical protein